MLIGGLGLGFTLQRVLADARVERAVVVEIEEPLIEWMRDGTVPHGPAILADARASVVNADIAMAIAEARSTYDLVLLDVDNGPGYLVHEGNERGLRAGVPRAGAATCCAPAGCSSSGRPTPLRTCSTRCAGSSAAPRSRPTTCCCRTVRSSTSSTSRGADQPQRRKASSTGPAVCEPETPVWTNTATARSPRVAIIQACVGSEPERVGLAVLGRAGLGPDLAGHVEQEPSRPGGHHGPHQAAQRARLVPGQRHLGRRLLDLVLGRSTGSTVRPAATDAATVAMANGLASTVPWPIMSAAAPVSVSGGGTWPK